MTMAMPRESRDRIRQKIWDKADELGWSRLSDIERTAWYENWSKDKDVGGALAHFMDPRKVRVYIKDSLLKPYMRARLEDSSDQALSAVGLLPKEVTVKQTFDKPHGCLLTDHKVVCWGNSRDWKSILISVFERAYRLESAIPFGAVLIETGQTSEDGIREMIECVAKRLQLTTVVWVDRLVSEL